MSNLKQLLRIDDVCKMTSLGRSTINLWVAEGRFPRPFFLSPTIKVWRSEQIDAWIDSLDPKTGRHFSEWTIG